MLGVASAVIAGFLPIGEAAELTNIGILLAFVVVCVAVIVLRYRQPGPAAHVPLPGHAGRARRSGSSSPSG